MTSACAVHGPGAPSASSFDTEISQLASASSLPTFPGYKNLRFLARGGFGLVFVAEPEGDVVGIQVAIKLAREDRREGRQRLVEEIRVLSDIGPPAVPAVHGHGETAAGTPYFVMDYLGDATLAERLVDRAVALPLGEAVNVAIAVARALEAVHRRGYVHRDLKPENIFVARALARPLAGSHDSPLRAILIDFGLVAGEGNTGDISEVTGEGPVVGTTDYMSPEQCQGQLDIDARADVYAMGVLLHELLVGRPPFWGPRAVVQEMHLSHRPPRLSAVDPERAIPVALEEVVARCLAKERKDRFANARELREALQAARSAESSDALPLPSSRAVVVRPVASDRLTVGLVFFVTDAEVTVVHTHIRALGGQVTYATGGSYVAVFGQALSDNPARRALFAAEEIVRQRLCAAARVDLETLTAQTKKDGTRRFVSQHFGRPERYPAAGDAPVTLTMAAAAVLPEVEELAADGLAADRALVEAPPSVRPRDSTPGAATFPTADVWPLMGRDELMAVLVESARQAVLEAVPTVVTVTADAGLGKSHVFRELARTLGTAFSAATVLTLRAREPVLGDADRTLIGLLRRGLDAPTPAPGLALDPDLPAALALALGRVSPNAPGSRLESELRSLGAAPGALRSAMTVAAGDALRQRAAGRPLLILLDDAHFAGDVALAALEHAALAEARVPIWVCALGRPALVQEHPRWGERAGRRAAHVLGPLSFENAAALCRRLLLPAESVPDSAVRRLVARAEAIPLLLVELVRGLQREGIVRRSPKGASWYLATDELDRLPDLPLVEWFARREIDALAPALRGHARLLALLGDHVTEVELAGVLSRIEARGGDVELPLDARVGSRRLVTAGLIARDAEGRYAYRHALVREAIAQGAPEAFRKLVHLAAADYYQEAETLGDHRRLSQLATHASAAGHGDEAARSFFELAERARSWHAYIEAERLYSRVLEQPGIAAGNRGAAHRGRGLMRYRIARYHDALADFSVARAGAEASGDAAASIEILLDEATALDWMDEFASSEARVREAQARLRPDSPPLLQARLLLALGRSAMHGSRNEQAADLLEQAVAAAEPLGAPGYETRVVALLLLSFLLPAMGRAEDAHHAVERAVALSEEHGDRLNLADALNTRAMIWGCMGDKHRMVADLSRSIAMARELGQLSLELRGEFNLGEHLLLMGDPDAAAPHIARALALDVRITGDPGRAVVALLNARLRHYTDDVAGAAAVIARIRSHQAEARSRGEPNTLMAPSDEILCAAIELSAADANKAQWNELEERSARISVGQERIEIIEARVLAAQRHGRLDEARRHLVRVMDLARRIPNAMGGRLTRRLAELD